MADLQEKLATLVVNIGPTYDRFKTDIAGSSDQ